MGALGPAELFFLLGICVVIPIIGIWIWSLIHCIKNQRLTDTNRIIGIALIVVLGIIGSLVYLFLPRQREVDKSEINSN